MRKLEGKVAIITGAGGGFGEATSILFAKEGAKIVVVDVDAEKGQHTVDEIKANGGEAIFVKTDVTKSEDCANMVRAAVETFGKLDILFNNAGVQGRCNDIAHMEEATFDKFMAVNVKGVWLGCHHAARELVKTKGVIINTASVAASLGSYGGTAYGVSKGAVLSMTYSLANELGLYGVRCNAISPASALTPFIAQAFGEEFLELRRSGNPLHKLIDIQDIANAALFLASDDSASITGLNLRVDAGTVIRSQPFDIEEFKKNNPYDL